MLSDAVKKELELELHDANVGEATSALEVILHWSDELFLRQEDITPAEAQRVVDDACRATVLALRHALTGSVKPLPYS